MITVIVCLVCHATIAQPTQPCPNCGADNQAWYAWLQAGWKVHLSHFFLGSFWGWLSLISLLLLPLVGIVFNFKFFTTEVALLLASWLISLIGLFWLFMRRDSLWIDELARRVSPGFQLGLLPLGSIGSFTFLGVGSILIVVWSGFPRIIPTNWGTLFIGLAFAGETLSAGLYSVYAYGRWLAKTFPTLIFLDIVRLEKLVEQVAIPHLEAATEHGQETAIRIIARSRTKQAGLNLKIRVETKTDKTWDGYFLTAVQPWRVVANRWGQVQLCIQDGSLEYELDTERVYVPVGTEPLLEGELIFPEKRRLLTVEEAILIALASEG